jgi:hypothetical protein
MISQFQNALRALSAGFFLLIAISQPALSQPSLTTVQDTIYLADGSPFTGLAFFDWKSFDAPNGAVIGQFSKVVRITDGLLRVQLAPTTNTTNAYYSVRYSKSGRILFTETWAVPPTNVTLRLRDVRATLLPGGFVSANTNPPPPSGNGGGNGNGNGNGGVIGENTGNFVDGEMPAGLINGSNNAFTLTAAPNPATSLGLYRNGVLLSAAVDYTITGNSITFSPGAAPEIGDVLRAYYRTGPIGGGNATHNLLSTTHSDTVNEPVQRGDLITGQASSPRWTRLPLGQPNRCLISNGLDAVWNACLFTGFTTGAVPFVNSSGVLAQNATNFTWDASNLRLGLGTASPTANLSIQAIPTQGISAMTRWTNPIGVELARMDSDGSLLVQRLTTITNNVRSAWRDLGSNIDPTQRQNGDFWFNNSQQTRKSFEAGQVHPMPQVICSSSGGFTLSTNSTQIGSCTIPAFFLESGDRLEVLMNFEHVGTASTFNVELRFGSQTVVSRTYAASDRAVFSRLSVGFYPDFASWGVQLFADSGQTNNTVINTSFDRTATAGFSFRGNLGSAGTDSVVLRNYAIIRYPAQFNP